MSVPNLKVRRRFDSLAQSYDTKCFVPEIALCIMCKIDAISLQIRREIFLYRINSGTLISVPPFSRISFASILVDRSLNIRLLFPSYFSFTLKNLCKYHLERVFTRDQLKLCTLLHTALFQLLFQIRL